MIVIRKSDNRGLSQHGWLHSLHTFSFADYYDSNHMGFGCIRVINEDKVLPGQGFAQHAHANMEIISYVIDGSLEHKDNLGTGSIIRPGEIQCMSAGAGVEHSEFNHSKAESVHFLQIWIIPETKQLPASYEQKKINQEKNKLVLIGSPGGGDNVITIHQDIHLFSAKLTIDNKMTYNIKKDRAVWLQLIRGSIDLNSQSVSAGDGVAITDEDNLEIVCTDDAELLLFDLTNG